MVSLGLIPKQTSANCDVYRVMMVALFAHAVGLFLVFFNLVSNAIDPRSV
jgi:hypothetical protein